MRQLRQHWCACTRWSPVKMLLCGCVKAGGRDRDGDGDGDGDEARRGLLALSPTLSKRVDSDGSPVPASLVKRKNSDMEDEEYDEQLAADAEDEAAEGCASSGASGDGGDVAVVVASGNGGSTRSVRGRLKDPLKLPVRSSSDGGSDQGQQQQQQRPLGGSSSISSSISSSSSSISSSSSSSNSSNSNNSNSNSSSGSGGGGGGGGGASHRVSFGHATVREYDRCLTDHPCVSAGVPLGLDWPFQEHSPEAIDAFEAQRRAEGRLGRDEYALRGRLSNQTRLALALRAGHGMSEIERVTADVEETKLRRYESAFRETANRIPRGAGANGRHQPSGSSWTSAIAGWFFSASSSE